MCLAKWNNTYQDIKWWDCQFFHITYWYRTFLKITCSRPLTSSHHPIDNGASSSKSWSETFLYIFPDLPTQVWSGFSSLLLSQWPPACTSLKALNSVHKEKPRNESPRRINNYLVRWVRTREGPILRAEKPEGKNREKTTWVKWKKPRGRNAEDYKFTYKTIHKKAREPGLVFQLLLL